MWPLGLNCGKKIGVGVQNLSYYSVRTKYRVVKNLTPVAGWIFEMDF